MHLKVARSLKLSRLATFRQVIFPSIFPSLLTGLRLGFSLTLLGVILGEMFASRAGFGYELVEAITLHDMPRMYGIVAVLVIDRVRGQRAAAALGARAVRADTLTAGIAHWSAVASTIAIAALRPRPPRPSARVEGDGTHGR